MNNEYELSFQSVKTHLCLMDFPISINGTTLFTMLGLLGGICAVC